MLKKALLFCSFLLIGNIVSADNNWLLFKNTNALIKPAHELKEGGYTTFLLNKSNMWIDLQAAALRGTSYAVTGTVTISIPYPDGTFKEFSLLEAPIMAPELAARYPDIKTYSGYAVNDPYSSIRVDMTPFGFHAMILSKGETIYVDPFSLTDNSHYVSYYRNSLIAGSKLMSCYTETISESTDAKRMMSVTSIGTQLRKYRLAVAATGEYSGRFGGTVAGALAGIVTTVNRVVGIYEKEVSITMELVANNDQIIYTNASTDPYTGANDLGENQTNTDLVIGTANYDIGHLVNTGGGGVAGLGVVCRAGQKARGTTGSNNPVGDAYDVDYVAHEMGHQFSGNHTFNSNTGSCNGNRSSTTAYEPGSGSTIMAYAGICSPQNVQSNSDAFFHTISFDEIVTYTTTGLGNGCAVITSTGNTPPVVNAGNNYIIPCKTPFTLNGSATDADSDVLTYNWEQFDLGPSGAPGTPSGDAPIIRSYAPATSGQRTIPRISNLVANTFASGEILPTYARIMHFRLTARDNKGGVTHSSSTVAIEAVNTGSPFLVSYPNASETLTGGVSIEVTWDVAGTDVNPISCSNVNILLSYDGGLTFPDTLKENVPNDGSQIVQIPDSASTKARIKVEAVGNIFFDISNTNFIIEEASSAAFNLSIDPVKHSVCLPGDAVYSISIDEIGGFSGAVALSVIDKPTGTNANFSTNPVSSPTISELTLSNLSSLAPGIYTFKIVGESGALKDTQVVQLVLAPSAPGAFTQSTPADGADETRLAPYFSWTISENATSYELVISNTPDFTDIALLVEDLTTNSYTPATNLGSEKFYYWRVRAINACAASNYSATRSFFTGPAIPLAPSLPKIALNAQNQIEFQWKDKSNNEVGFIIERSANDESNFSPIDSVAEDIQLYIDSNFGSKIKYYYRARAYNAGGNSNPSVSISITSPSVFVESKLNEESISIYPNPGKGHFFITIAIADVATIEIQVYNSLAQLIHKEIIKKGTPKINIPLNLSEQAKGLYICKLITSKGTLTKKVVIE